MRTRKEIQDEMQRIQAENPNDPGAIIDFIIRVQSEAGMYWQDQSINLRKWQSYVQAIITQNLTGETKLPPFVPSRIRLVQMIHGDNSVRTQAGPGVTDCRSNKWGAVSVKDENGKYLGVRPHQFEVVAWRENVGEKS
mgnify:CR=1 FL=1